MKYSEERCHELAFKIHDRLYMNALVDYPDEEQALFRMKEILAAYFAKDNDIHDFVVKKIQSLKKEVLPGSAEWDILYQKYKEEEQNKRRR